MRVTHAHDRGQQANNRVANNPHVEVYVQVPVALLESSVPATALVTWALLSSYTRDGQPMAWPSRETLLRRLGKTGNTPKVITRATTRLQESGWLRTRQARVGGKTRNMYEPLGRPEPGSGQRFAVLPQHALRALEQGSIGVEALRTYLCWVTLCGRVGWTTDALNDLVNKFGGTTRTAQTHRSNLVDAGLLDVAHRAGRVSITAIPGRLPVPDAPDTPETDGPPPQKQTIPRSTSRRTISRRNICPWSCPKGRYST